VAALHAPRPPALEPFTYRHAEELVQAVLPALARRLVCVPPSAEGDRLGEEASWPYTRPHAHTHPEAAVCVEGRALVRVAGEVWDLRPCGAVVVAAGLLHNESCAEPGTAYALLWCATRGDTAQIWLSHYDPQGVPPFRVEHAIHARAVGCRLLAYAATEASLRRPGWEEAASDYLRALLRMASRQGWRTRVPAPEFVHRAIAFVQANYQRDLSASTVAKAVGVSPERLRKAFQEYLNMAPARYITATRMAAAAYLLGSSRLSLREVARLCGYRDPLYFSRVCSRWHGAPPSALRRRTPSSQAVAGEADLERWQGTAWSQGAPRQDHAGAPGVGPGEGQRQTAVGGGGGGA
jgi:AraC-like DNA-binding protein